MDAGFVEQSAAPHRVAIPKPGSKKPPERRGHFGAFVFFAGELRERLLPGRPTRLFW